MTDCLNKSAAFCLLPKRIIHRLRWLCGGRVGGVGSVSELHLMLGDRSSFISHGQRVYLATRVTREDMAGTLSRLCDGALYAHRDTINRGYVTLSDGVRVGISGLARYEGGSIVGVSEVNSLVFRIPTYASSLSDELLAAYRQAERGLVIYARAGVGKTTALRTLAGLIAREGKRVVVVDERCEFSCEDCQSSGVVLMRGYKRAEGMEIALRTLTPDVMMVDELGDAAEAEGMLSSLNSGVKLIATAHASSLDELMRRSGVLRLTSVGVFDTALGIFHTDAGYSSKFERLK